MRVFTDLCMYVLVDACVRNRLLAGWWNLFLSTTLMQEITNATATEDGGDDRFYGLPISGF